MRRVLCFLLVMALCGSGCRSLDVASQHQGPPPSCEAHEVQMHPEWIDVSSGETAYVMPYMQIMKKRFPHHGGVVLSGERSYRYPFERRVRDFVCPRCADEYAAYWKETGR